MAESFPILVNLTPHPIGLSVDGVVTTVPPSGTVARVSSTPGEQCGVGSNCALRGTLPPPSPAHAQASCRLQ